MIPTDFPEANLTLKKPRNMTEEDCSSLRVYVNQDGFISCWKPTLRERFILFFKGRIWLTVLGQEHPPVRLQITTPFVEE